MMHFSCPTASCDGISFFSLNGKTLLDLIFVLEGGGTTDTVSLILERYAVLFPVWFQLYRCMELMTCVFQQASVYPVGKSIDYFKGPEIIWTHK